MIDTSRNRLLGVSLLLVCLLLPEVSARAWAADFVGEPYLCNPRMDGMTVGWTADAPDVGEVRYGETESYGKTAAITLCDRIAQKPNARSERFACRARLRGLTPGVTYHYKVSGNGIEGERTGTFRIPKRDEPLLIVFQSDASPVTDQDIAFVEEKVGRAVDLLVDAGDTIQHGRDFFDFKPALYRRIPLVLAQGNHEPDWRQKNIGFHYLDYEAGTADRREHSVDYGPARWIVGPYVQYADDFTAAQLAWIEDQLKSTDRSWKFYVCHHIFFSDGYHSTLRWGTDAGEGVRRRRSLWPLLTKYDARIAVNGHDHVYQRTFPIDKDGNVTPTGTVNLDVATGNSVRPQKSPWMARFIRSEADREVPITGVTYMFLDGDKGAVEFHTRPTNRFELGDFDLADRFTFSPTRFHDDARVPRALDWKLLVKAAPRKRDTAGNLLPLQSYDETIRRGMSFILDDHLKWFKGPPQTIVDENGKTQMPWVYYSNLQHNGAPFPNSIDRFVSYPAFHHSLMIRTLIGYWKYANDPRALKRAVELADWNIAHSTPADWPYAHLPYSTFEEKKPGGFRDKTGLMPDKAAIMALAYLDLHEATGEARFHTAAENIANTLSARQRPNGTWPFRVDPKTEKVIEEYTSSVIYALMLFERLDAANGTNRYKAKRDLTWNWLMNGPIKTKDFRGFYEDIPPSPKGRTNYDCLDTIRYLIANHTAENGYLEIAVELNAWIEKIFLDKIKGFEPAEGIREQLQCNVVMGIHSLNWASMLYDLAEATGDEKMRERAVQTANYITYYLQPDNRIVVGFQYHQWWYSCHVGVVLYLMDFVED